MTARASRFPGEVVVAHAGWEIFVMRALFAWLCLIMLPAAVPYLSQPVPNGLAHWLDLTFLADPATYAGLRGAMAVSLAGYVLGVLPAVTLGFPAVLLTLVGTLENSQGAIGHHLQVTCLVALAQTVVYAMARGEGGGPWWRPDLSIHRRAVHWAKLVIVAAYMTSACVKLIASGGLWIVQLPDISLQLLKTHANVYYDTLVPQQGWLAERLPEWIWRHPNLTRLAFGPGLLLELGAFVALAGRRPALLIGAGLLVMHVLARVVMKLAFSAHEWLLVIYLVNLPYFAIGIGRGLKRRWGRRFEETANG